MKIISTPESEAKGIQGYMSWILLPGTTNKVLHWKLNINDEKEGWKIYNSHPLYSSPSQIIRERCRDKVFKGMTYGNASKGFALSQVLKGEGWVYVVEEVTLEKRAAQIQADKAEVEKEGQPILDSLVKEDIKS